MAKFCPHCGKEVNEGAAFCSNCGGGLNGQQQNQQQQQYGQQAYGPQYGQQAYGPQYGAPYGAPYGQPPYQAYGYAPQKNVLQEVSSKIHVNGVIWMVIAIIQYVLGAIFFFAGLGIGEGLSLFQGILLLAVATVNIVVSTRDMKYSKEILSCPVGIYARVSPIGKYIGTLIYNILFGGLIGIAGSIYGFVVRSYVVSNEMQLAQIEQQFMAQQNR